ncbi:MAG: acetylglutamate kinase, partial [Planctomycetota bacterium]
MSAALKAGGRLVLKVGGAILDDAAKRAAFAASVARVIEELDASVVVVHGGGAQLSRQCERLGIDVQRNDRGLRITDEATLAAAVQVLAGEVNAALVTALSAASVAAIGMTGADAGLMKARRLDASLGAVGEVESVSAAVLDRLSHAGFVPVVATLAPELPETSGSSAAGSATAGSGGSSLLNVNADAAVAPIAAAYDADAVLFLSDVAAVLNGPVLESAEPLESLSPASAKELEASGALGGGMIPKVDAALAAVNALPNALV